ncbi:glycosyl-4,4'-diaponeurosporenoate acyltransferase CrtO family protein [Flavobacterium oreochromis]|uniref:glycosyl-4,4'-diaponeurosporenoate acyltransferase CrtO family protein n=1 Tax=Flavobacterium oreochromis TaxID=2906078 RepID=UPI00385857D5
MGVSIVKWIAKNTFFKYLNPNLKINGKVNISDFKNIREQMTKAEIDHLFAFLFVMIFVIIKIYNEEYILALIILILNILMNLCPTLLQQRNKRRIDKFISKFSK